MNKSENEANIDKPEIILNTDTSIDNITQDANLEITQKNQNEPEIKATSDR